MMPLEGILTTTNYTHFQICTDSGTVLVEFQGAKKANKALPGDRVEWKSETNSCTLLKRADHPPIVGVIELVSKTKYGLTSRGNPLYLFLPCDKSYPIMVVGCSKRNPTTNILALVEFEDWSATGFARTLLREELGPVGDPDVEALALEWTYNPWKLNRKALQAIPPPDKVLMSERVETPQRTFNIDPAGCRDIDDVLSLEEHLDTLELWITIADVAEQVAPESALDRFAKLQGATSYRDGSAVRPMLPVAYSEGACSLVPGVERPGLSLILTYAKGSYDKPLHTRWSLSRVVNQMSYTYEEFSSQAPADAILLRSMAKGLWPKVDLEDCHTWIEAFMLTYNLEVAKQLRLAGQGILRKHAIADLERFAQLSLWGGDALAVLANRSAEYCPANDDAPTHYGLSAQTYCHASSPIRRYADLVNQRILKAILTGKQLPEVTVSIPWLNQRQTALKRFERDSFFLFQLQDPNTRCSAIVLERKERMLGDRPLHCLKLWVPAWKRVLSWKTSLDCDGALPGVNIVLSYFANPTARHWKEKIVFRFEGIH